MKKKALLLAGALLFNTLGALVFTSCDKDTYSHLEVTVKDQLNNHTVPNAMVIINMDGGSIADTGYTNDDGVYKTEFAAPAVFNLYTKAFVIDTPAHPIDQYICYRTGSSSIRLKEGETVTAVIPLESTIYTELVTQ